MIFEDFFTKLAGKIISQKLDLKEDSKMDEVKPWYKSKTVLSDIATVAISIVGLIDIHFTGGKIAASPYYQTILALLGGIGIYGRTTATKKIG